jgi:hypothetical protein
MKYLLILPLLLLQMSISAQLSADKGDWKKIYRSFPEKINDVVHTKLEAKLVFEQ